MPTDRTSSFDVIVVGGGPAGLNGALLLARSRRSVLVVDSGEPRNGPAGAVHGLLGHDGRPPGELLALRREEVERYGGHVVSGRVVSLSGTVGSFTATCADGTELTARRLLLTTGLTDELPDVPGVAERWGRDVVHCPYCHGWEVREEAIGVLASGPMSVHQALLFRQLSSDVVYLRNDTALDPEQAGLLAGRGIDVVDGPVAQLVVEDDRLAGVRLGDGSVVPRTVVSVAGRVVARDEAFAGLGIRAVAHPSGMGVHVSVDASGRTQVAGVWAAGNLTDPAAQVGTAAAAGASAAAQINTDLVMEEAEASVASGS